MQLPPTADIDTADVFHTTYPGPRLKTVSKGGNILAHPKTAPVSLRRGGPPLPKGRLGHSGAAAAPTQSELHRLNQHA
eukprot:10335583-Alexandrium_andersonii.AAC.1